MPQLLLRNIAIPDRSVAWASPSEVPDHVDDAALAACLRAGRPAGEPGLLTVRGIGCPTIAAGTGRPVLCVHGLGHDAWDWTPFFVQCSKSASLLALDLPGFGLADKPADTSYDMDLYVEAVLEAAALSHEPPAIVASSLGGHIAILAALKQPAAFSKLVLAAPGGLVDAPSALQSMLRAYYSVDAICGRSDGEITGNSARIFAKPGCAFDGPLAARKLAVHRSRRKREFAVPFSGIVDDVFRHVIASRVAEIKLPTLFLSGARDVVVPPDACAAAARRMNARFISFNDVGHCPHLEAPDAFADAVMTFIQGGQ